MKTYNIGEWSEIYTFLKLLAEGKIFAADENLNAIESIFYPLISILRKEADQNLIFNRNSHIKILSAETSEVLAEVPIETFKENSLKLLEAMKSASSSVFQVPDVEEFLKSIRITNLKASSSDKYDITMIVHDPRTNTEPTLKMSIKSMLGSPSTLFNPGSATNFIYKIVSNRFSENDAATINKIGGKRKIIDRLKAIIDSGATLEFDRVEGKQLENNMKMVDTNLPEIMAYLLKLYYLYGHQSMKILTEKVETDDPLKFYQEKNLGFYIHKIKYFLLSVALGMTPAKPWDGNYSASGGYVIVKPNGELLIYHIYNIDQFKDYLLGNTKLDKPSSTRYGYAHVYKEDGKFKVKLNLQIRFVV